jgi:hypothetical protein
MLQQVPDPVPARTQIYTARRHPLLVRLGNDVLKERRLAITGSCVESCGAAGLDAVSASADCCSRPSVTGRGSALGS